MGLETHGSSHMTAQPVTPLRTKEFIQLISEAGKNYPEQPEPEMKKGKTFIVVFLYVFNLWKAPPSKIILTPVLARIVLCDSTVTC